jgi:hypothetical protein
MVKGSSSILVGEQDEVTKIMASKKMWMRILFFMFIPSQLINYTQIVNSKVPYGHM